MRVSITCREAGQLQALVWLLGVNRWDAHFRVRGVLLGGRTLFSVHPDVAYFPTAE